MKRRVVVIGGGFGGYPAALILAQKGAEVTLIEKDRLGGTCLNKGCIPTKIFLHAANFMSELEAGKKFGIYVQEVHFDFVRLMKHKERVVNGLVKGVEKLCQLRNVKIVKGTATFDKPNEIHIRETGQIIQTDAVIVSTGAVPETLPISGVNSSGVITSDEVSSLNKIPKSIVIIGGGYVGLEFSQIFKNFGAEVTVLEMLSSIIPAEDPEVCAELLGALRSRGIKIVTDASVEKISGPEGQIEILYRHNGKTHELRSSHVLLAVGRMPNTEFLNLEKVGVKTEKGAIKVNDHMETSTRGIYAIGDVIGGVMMAHVATAEGETAAKNILGHKVSMDYRAVPRCIYTHPEVASAGLTEAEAKEIHGNIAVGTFPLQFSGKAHIVGGTGFAKVITEKTYGRVLGVHLVGPHVTEMIAEAVMAINLECTADELAHSMHPHPTLSEAVMEAAMSIEGYKINSI